MARPQKENGYTPVAHEILDEICQYSFNGSQLRIILKVWRLTYGFNRKDHDFSLTFLQDTTRLSESTVKREVAFLTKNKVLLITKEPTSTESRRFSFNKNYDEWLVMKSGDEMVKQHDHSSMEEGSDSTPPINEEGGFRSDPSGGSDMNPQEAQRGVQIRPPYKEIKILKKSIKEKEAMFDKFYENYPRRIARKKAESSWRTLCKESGFDPDQAIAYTLNFIETSKLLGTETKYIPYPATFLNQRRFADYPCIDPEGIAAASGSTKFDKDKDELQRLMREAEERERNGSRQTLLDNPDRAPEL